MREGNHRLILFYGYDIIIKKRREIVTTKELFVKQLSKDQFLTEDNYKQIAGLIYDTDQYIFPAMFYGNDNPRMAAIEVISYVLKTETDNMYSKDNLFVCFNNMDIVGMILWCFGTIDWNYIEFIESAREVGIHLEKDIIASVNEAFFGRTKKNIYFSDVNAKKKIELINVCVDSSFRGNGIASFMLKEFLSQYSTNEMELCVLQENVPALSLYSQNGFRVISEYPGFSLTTQKPMCYGMKKSPINF